MLWIVIAVVIVAAAIFLLAKRSEKEEPAQESFPYQKSEAIFTPAERSFFGVLHHAVGNNAAIFGKVRVADVVKPKAGLGRSAWKKAFNKISAKHFDFLLCNKKELSVACAIELNDASHNSKHRQERDEFLNRVCEAAGIQLVQVPAKLGYVISEVKHLLPRDLTIKDSPEQEPYPAPSIQESSENEKVCPNCSASMVKRVARNGKHAGKQFWACSAFPRCKTVEPISA